MPAYRIGIDLGTTNSALAFVPSASADGIPKVLPIPQPETAHSSIAAEMLPSFLLLPPANEGPDWVVGRFARKRSAEVPSRVVQSAKSWLVHHAADRTAKFLPFGSSDIPAGSRLSPVDALAKILATLAAAWDSAHPDAPLAGQDIAITVPASFDPAAQELTLRATRQAGFPPSTILIEEPQAAFYAWLESSSETTAALAPGKTSHILVIDIGGGTTDLSLFSAEWKPDSPLPHLQRMAVSDHILLGGDNLDLALAHHLEEKLAPGSQLHPTTFAQLAARARELKEDALSSPPGEEKTWPVAVAKPGASLLAGTLQTEIASSTVRSLLLDGFFPDVQAGEQPLRAAPGLREMGLPYAKDAAITRHISDFLRNRPPVDFILFNGGVTKSPAIRVRLAENIARWQPSHPAKILENTDPDLAVARGAARFLWLRASGGPACIEAGASHAYYIAAGENSAVCVLPQNAAAEQPQTASPPNLRATVGQPVSFRLFRNARRPSDQTGSIVPTTGEGFFEIPAVETILAPPAGKRPPRNPSIRVEIQTTLRSTGLLRIKLLAADPALDWKTAWPLDFQLRAAATGEKKSADTSDTVSQAARQLALLFDPDRKSRQKLTANTFFTLGEKALGSQKSAWTAGIVRRIFDEILPLAESRRLSSDHEETWLHAAGWLLRPGCGMTGDPERAAALAKILSQPPIHSSGAVKIQRWICARRIAAGLDPQTALGIWSAAEADWKPGSNPSAETALLAGALESLPAELRAATAARLAEAILRQPSNPAYWKGLGRLLSRVLFHAGAEQILPPACAESAWTQLSECDPGPSLRPEAAACWLRAARLTGLRAADLPKPTRQQIDSLLKSWEIPEPRRRALHETIPPAAAEQTGLLGESPPPGLSFD